MNAGNTNIDFDKIVECYFYIHRLDFIFGEIEIFVINKNLGQLFVCYTNNCPKPFLFSVIRKSLFAYAGFLHSILHLLADVLRNGVDVHHIVHCVCNDEVLRHIPDSFVVTGFTP